MSNVPLKSRRRWRRSSSPPNKTTPGREPSLPGALHSSLNTRRQRLRRGTANTLTRFTGAVTRFATRAVRRAIARAVFAKSARIACAASPGRSADGRDDIAQRGLFRHRGFVGTARFLAGFRLGRSRLDLGRLGRAADTFAGIATQAITRFTAATAIDTVARAGFAQTTGVAAATSTHRLRRRGASSGREHNTYC